MTTYDHALEGNAYPALPIPQVDPAKLQAIAVKSFMREYVSKIRRFQEVSIQPGDAAREIAFVNSLRLLHAWCEPTQQHINEMSAHNFKYHVRFNRDNFDRLIQNTNILLWTRKADGEKVYFNFKALSRDQVENLFGTAEQRQLFLETYDGRAAEPTPIEDIQEIGVSFYQYQSRALQKTPEQQLQAAEFLDIEVYKHHRGGFFAYVPTIPIDLEVYGIYNVIKKENYKDNCFIKACAESGVLSSTEIDALRSFIRFREVPRAKIRDISDFIKCNFIIRTMDETKDKTHRIEYYMNTMKGKLGKDYGRTIDIVLWREHYMINKPVNITPYYIAHYEEILEKFPDMPIERRQLICNAKGDKTRSKGYKLSDILFALHENERLRPIYKYESDIIKTSEYDNSTLQDYEDLDYEESLCCKEVIDDKPAKEFEYIFYADFESDITVNPHRAYLCCVVWRDKDGRGRKQTFRGYNCGAEFLDFVPNNSLVYFHNLKYDASFFINQSIGTYSVNMIDHSGKIMMLKFRQIKGGNKQFTIKDSYSVISKPLRAFGKMFNLDVHKEVCPYNIYTASNIKKRFVPLAECLADIPDDNKEAFMDNCKQVGCYYKVSDSVEIMMYAEFY